MQMIAVDAAALAEVLTRLKTIEDKLDGATVQARADWLTIKEAAEALKVTPDTIRRKAASGEIEARGSGKCRMVKLAG